MIDSGSLRLSKLLLNVGNKSFLHPRVLLFLAAPLAIIFSVAAAEPANFTEMIIWLAANLLSLAVLAILIQLFRFVRSKTNWKIIPLAVVIAIAAVIGAVKSFSTIYFAGIISWGELPTPDLLVTVVSATSLAVPIIVASSVFETLRREFTRDRGLLITAKGLQQMRKNSSELEKRLGELALNLRNLANELKTTHQSELRPMEMRLIRGLVNQQVRPLATSVFESLEKSIQSFRFGRLWSAALQTRPNALAISLPLMLNLFQVAEVFGLAAALVSVISITITSTVIIYLAGKFFEIIGFQTAFSYYLSSVSGPLLSVFLTLIITGELSSQIPVLMTVLLISSFLVSTIIGMIQVALASGVENRQVVEEIIKTDLNLEFASLAKQSKDIANQIHGEVQSRLMNMILQAQSGEAVSRNRAVEELINIANLLERSTPDSSDFGEFMQNLQRTWSGFTTISHSLSDEDIDINKLSDIQAIIEEAVTNAFKHGMASQVEISIADGRLSVSDNGIGPTRGKEGLGSRMLDAFSEDWKLKSRPQGGTELSVKI